VAYEPRLDPDLTRLAADAFVAYNAVIVGDVQVAREASIWFGVVARGDVEQVRVGRRSNVQDCAVLHADAGFPCIIGTGVTVGHRAIVHGARIADHVLIGMGATLMNGATVGEYSVVGANALVTAGTEIPPRSLVLGMPGRVVRQVSDEEVALIASSAEHYVINGRTYREQGFDRLPEPRAAR
jgi:carbonic anhydrase/acetyltransferase-like protein (isoleucine patch superfamily)